LARSAARSERERGDRFAVSVASADDHYEAKGGRPPADVL
jgi:hypothetical protein